MVLGWYVCEQAGEVLVRVEIRRWRQNGGYIVSVA